MIEQLKKEIFDLEVKLEDKKNLLKNLIEESIFDKPKLLVIVEIEDQFSGIDNVLLIDDNENEIKKIKEEYNKRFIYCYNINIYRITEKDVLKEVFKDLKHNLELINFGDDSTYEWMQENQDKLI